MGLKYKMEMREPLFRLEKVEAAFQEMQKRQADRRQQLKEEETQQWEHLRSLEENAAKRPLLIENPNYRHPRPRPESAPDLGHRPRFPFGREEYECDKRIRSAIQAKWFERSEWGQAVKQ